MSSSKEPKSSGVTWPSMAIAYGIGLAVVGLYWHAVFNWDIPFLQKTDAPIYFSAMIFCVIAILNYLGVSSTSLVVFALMWGFITACVCFWGWTITLIALGGFIPMYIGVSAPLAMHAYLSGRAG